VFRHVFVDNFPLEGYRFWNRQEKYKNNFAHLLNGARVRLWKKALQGVANETRLGISVCHLPPGTSKWNKIEHRLFSFTTKNWRGKPLISYEVVVNLIASTTTETGLTVRCQLDPNSYQKGIKVSDEEFAKIRLQKDEFHGEWNYTILPHTT
jgi:hypothetical protein